MPLSSGPDVSASLAARERCSPFWLLCSFTAYLAVFGRLALLFPTGPVQIKRTGYKYVCYLTGSRAALPAAFMFGLQLLSCISQL